MSYLGICEYLYPIEQLPEDVQRAWSKGEGFVRLGWDEDEDPVAVFDDGTKRKLDPQWVQRIKD